MFTKNLKIFEDTGVSASFDLITDLSGGLIYGVNSLHYSLSVIVANPSTFTGTIQPIISNDGGVTWTLIRSQINLPVVAGSVIDEDYLRGAIFGVRFDITGGSADLSAFLTLK